MPPRPGGAAGGRARRAPARHDPAAAGPAALVAVRTAAG
ncbi:hypothetical protein I546_4362 [Mycobacterium kansasii 732]|nr:hypothetical protein I546_4362 [Mycobacterium kansasii 732]